MTIVRDKKEMRRDMNILVIDAQGGGLGKQIITMIKKELPDEWITAIGTNATATATMLKAGANEVATGENSVVVACRKADVIIGPIGIIIADAMLGEITATMASAVARSRAKRIFIPFRNCDNYIAGVSDFNTGKLIMDAMEKLREIQKSKL